MVGSDWPHTTTDLLSLRHHVNLVPVKLPRGPTKGGGGRWRADRRLVPFHLPLWGIPLWGCVKPTESSRHGRIGITGFLVCCCRLGGKLSGRRNKHEHDRYIGDRIRRGRGVGNLRYRGLTTSVLYIIYRLVFSSSFPPFFSSPYSSILSALSPTCVSSSPTLK